jgi:WhiB family transcriptional regulator, redox-sensing transcriptional regulator
MLAEEYSEERQRLWAQARCNDGAGTLVALFFSEQLDDIARAKAICGLCPVQQDCFEGALARREPWGVWGGHLFLNGKVLAHKRKRGRPPKNAQPLSA